MEGDFSAEFLNQEQQDPIEQFFSSEQRSLEEGSLFSGALLAVSESIERERTPGGKLKKTILGAVGLAIVFMAGH